MLAAAAWRPAPRPAPPAPLPPVSVLERRTIDYSELDYWMAHADQLIRITRRRLERLAPGPTDAAREALTRQLPKQLCPHRSKPIREADGVDGCAGRPAGG